MNKLLIRLAVTGDASTLIDLHRRSISALCREDYDDQQIRAWIGKRVPQHVASIMLTRPFFVAEIDGQVVGYAYYRPRTAEVQSIYVDPDYARQGIGGRLMEAISNHARHLGITSLWLDASLTAVPFYRSVGFEDVLETTHAFQGIPLACLRMEMALTD